MNHTQNSLKYKKLFKVQKRTLSSYANFFLMPNTLKKILFFSLLSSTYSLDSCMSSSEQEILKFDETKLSTHSISEEIEIKKTSGEYRILRTILEVNKSNIKKYLRTKKLNYINRSLMGILKDIEENVSSLKINMNGTKLFKNKEEKGILNEYMYLSAIVDCLCPVEKVDQKLKPFLKNYLIGVLKKMQLKTLKNNKIITESKSGFYAFTDNIKKRDALFGFLSEEENVSKGLQLSELAIKRYNTRLSLKNLYNIKVKDLVFFAYKRVNGLK